MVIGLGFLKLADSLNLHFVIVPRRQIFFPFETRFT